MAARKQTMYERYEIEKAEAPPLRPFPNKFHPKVARLGLAKMLVSEAFRYRFDKEILLSRPCIYGVFSGPLGGFMPRRELCVGCMRCVQEYPEFCEVSLDERYQKLGDSYFGPHALSTLNYEATTGKVPVKGVGYKGPFVGKGFDALWTDMSEIVRPTRDGIYGREYISTVVDIGRRPAYLKPEGEPENDAPVASLPVPFLFDAAPAALERGDIARATLEAARRIKTCAVVPAERLGPESAAVIPLLKSPGAKLPPGPFAMLECENLAPADFSKLQKEHPESVVIARLPLGPDSSDRVLALAASGAGSFHLTADYHGRCEDGGFVLDALRGLHAALVDKGNREELTLIVSGGIVRAEHIPKAILCGADLVALDTPVWAALGAEFSGEFASPGSARLRVPRVPHEWGAQRIVNFCASWRDQLLEILSAMGLREVRRLRGELGRAIFFEEMEKEAFGDLAHE